MNIMVTNSITIIFITITLLYAARYIILNNSIYNFIKEEYKNLAEEYTYNSSYLSIKQKYYIYAKDTVNTELNLSSFLEEVSTNYNFKNKSIIVKLSMIKKAPGICILLGVLGTFVGLSILLITIQPNDMNNTLPEVISSMQTAFITSIVGIVCSILIDNFIDNKNCELALTQLFLKIENMLTSEVSHNKNITNHNKLERIERTLIEIYKTLKSVETFEQISIDLEIFNKEFFYSIDNLKEILYESNISIKSFEDNMNKLDKQFSILNVKLAKISDIMEVQQSINKEVLSDIKEVTQNILSTTEVQQKIKEYIKNIDDTFGLYDKNIRDLVCVLIKNNNEIESDINNEEIYEIEDFQKENMSDINGDDLGNE